MPVRNSYSTVNVVILVFHKDARQIAAINLDLIIFVVFLGNDARAGTVWDEPTEGRRCRSRFFTVKSQADPAESKAQQRRSDFAFFSDRDSGQSAPGT